MSQNLDNFSQDFVSSFFEESQSSNHIRLESNYAYQLIKDAWTQNIPFLYKDDKCKQPDLFIRANRDGSEELVKMEIPQEAKNASEIKYTLIQPLYSPKNGQLYKKIIQSGNHPRILGLKPSKKRPAGRSYLKRQHRKSHDVNNQTDPLHQKTNLIP